MAAAIARRAAVARPGQAAEGLRRRRQRLGALPLAVRRAAAARARQAAKSPRRQQRLRHGKPLNTPAAGGGNVLQPPRSPGGETSDVSRRETSDAAAAADALHLQLLQSGRWEDSGAGAWPWAAEMV